MKLLALLNKAEQISHQIINAEGDITLLVAEVITLLDDFNLLFSSSLENLTLEETQKVQLRIDTLCIEIEAAHNIIYQELNVLANLKKLQKNYV